MFYSTPTVISRLIQLFDYHVKKYGQDPRRICMTKKEWDSYKEEVYENPTTAYIYAAMGFLKVNKKLQVSRRAKKSVICLSFRGVPVVMIEDWKKLIKEDKQKLLKIKKKK